MGARTWPEGKLDGVARISLRSPVPLDLLSSPEITGDSDGRWLRSDAVRGALDV